MDICGDDYLRWRLQPGGHVFNLDEVDSDGSDYHMSINSSAAEEDDSEEVILDLSTQPTITMRSKG